MGLTYEPLINYRSKTNKNGKYLIHLHVTIDRISKYYEVPVPQKVPLADWTGKPDQWVSITNPYAFQINQAIADLKKKVTGLHKRFFDQQLKLTFFHLNQQLGFEGNRHIFNNYFKEFMRPRPLLCSPRAPGRNMPA